MVKPDEDMSTLVESEAKSRLSYLVPWLEFGDRPPPSLANSLDLDLLSDDADDLVELRRRCAVARLSASLEEWEEEGGRREEAGWEASLDPRPSGVPGAGLGLWATASIEEGEVVCFYEGHLHDYRSQALLEDKSYLMAIGGVFVDPGPLKEVLARYINDPLCEESRNCEFVPEAGKARAKVRTTRRVEKGEELFASYGDLYWSQQPYEGVVWRKQGDGSSPEQPS